MKRSIPVLALMFLIAAFPATAAVETQLFLDAGGGTTATITVDSLNTVSCVGSCGGFTTLATTGAHGQLVVLGTLGTFKINTTGEGDLFTTEPTLQNLNQIQATSAGAGTLIAEFTDTDYTTLAPYNLFFLSASTVNNAQIVGSTTDFYAYADAGNGIPASAAGALIGSFLGLTGPSDNDFGNFASPIIGSTGSLTTRTVITFTGVGTVQANFTIANGVPEPASVMMLGTLLLGAGGLLRKRFAK